MNDPYTPIAGALLPSEHVKLAFEADMEVSDGSAERFTQRRIFAVVSNVDRDVEEACVFIFRLRKNDPKQAVVVGIIPIYQDFKVTMSQVQSASAAQEALTAALLGNSKRSADFQFIVSSEGMEASGISTDSQTLRDFIVITKDLVAIAKEHKFTKESGSHAWTAAYWSRLPPSASKRPLPASSNYASLPAKSGDGLGESSGLEYMKVRIGTWNVNGRLPEEDISSWLQADSRPDLLVLGFQELDLSTEAYLYWTPFREQAWNEAIMAGLGPLQSQYTKIASKQLVGVLLLVYASDAVVSQISDISVSSVSLGWGGWTGNKGAVGVRFRVDADDGSGEVEGKDEESGSTQSAGTYVTFVNSHLAALHDQVERRNWDHNEVIKRLTFPRGEGTSPFDADRLTGGDEVPTVPGRLSMFDSHYIFWFGDLNYRVDLSINEVKRLLQRKQYSVLLKFDQLHAQKRLGAAFANFMEGEIRFPPTFKYDVGTNDFDTSEKQRIPAWTDRILWHAHRRPGGVKLISYTSHPELLGSDHKPVSASFIVSLSTPRTPNPSEAPVAGDVRASGDSATADPMTVEEHSGAGAEAGSVG